MTPQELRDRLARFARDMALAVRPLATRPTAADSARQLARAAAAAAANHRAAGRARSLAEFAAKINIALEEIDEAMFWFGHLRGIQELGQGQHEVLHREGHELVAILSRSVQTARRRQAAARKTSPRSTCGRPQTPDDR